MTRREGTAWDQADGMADGIHVRQTNSPLRLGGLAAWRLGGLEAWRLGGLAAFPFLVPSRTGRGSKAAKPQSREGDGGNNRETVLDRLLRLIVAVENSEVHKSGDEPCRVQ